MLKIDKNKTYYIACSFGPDSMALFNMLIQENISFEVLHVNYGLRKEAKKETEDLIKYCQEKNINIKVFWVNEKLKENNIEAKCRKIRYDFFAEIFKKNPKEGVLVAHQEDDLIETYLLQKKRNNFPYFYGLKKETIIAGVKIIRPLLNFSKAELLSYCIDNQIPFAIDKTNLLDIYERNKIRHAIVEKMSREDRKAILNKIAIENKNLGEMQCFLKNIDIHDIGNLLKLDDTSFCYAVNIMAKKIMEDCSISKKTCNEIKKILSSNKSQVQLMINKDLRFSKNYDRCCFELINKTTAYEYVLNQKTTLETPYFYIDLINESQNRILMNASFPLTIRNAKKDDFYTISNYKCKVRRLFIDWKMPNQLRDIWPVIIDATGTIIYIPRYQKDFKISQHPTFYVKY